MEPTFIPTMGAVTISFLSVAVAVADPGLGLGHDPDRALHDWPVRRLMQPSPYELKLVHDPDRALRDWQVRRLMQPSPYELKKERRGSVYIYDGLTEREVETALDTNFDRIQHMMFMGTVRTDASGQPLRDTATGQLIQESGGCSSPE